MKQRTLLLSLLLSFNVTASHAQIWDILKEKAKDAWNSDERKEAWEKTKEVSAKAMEVTDNALEPYRYTVPVTGRKFLNPIPDEEMNSLGAKHYSSFLQSATLSSNKNETSRVKRVAARLTDAVDEFYAEQGLEEDFEWEVSVVEKDEVNAWCMPGGKIAVYEGILPVANTDATLAIVLGHEIGHAIAKHSAEQMTKGIVSTAGMAAIYMLIDSKDMSSSKNTLAKILTSGGITLAALKFSRIDEAEADHIGLILAAMAGYDPDEAIPFWKRMAKATNKNSVRDWYSTHPSNANRIANIQKILPEAREYYNKQVKN